MTKPGHRVTFWFRRLARHPLPEHMTRDEYRAELRRRDRAHEAHEQTKRGNA